MSADVIHLLDVLKDKSRDPLPALNGLLSILTSTQLEHDQLKSIIPLIIPHLQSDDTSIPSLMILNSVQSLVIETPKIILEGLDTQIELSKPVDFIKILTNLSHLLNDLVSGLFLNNDQVINLITNEILKVSNESNVKSQLSILSLFSSLCLNDECKSIIGKSYQNFLVSSIQSSSKEVQCLSSLVVIKLWSFLPLDLLKSKQKFLSLDNLSTILMDSLTLDESIEGLSLLSSNIQIKSKMRSNETLISDLLTVLKLNNQNSFGVLSIIENLSLPNQFLKRINPQISKVNDKNDLSNVDIFTTKMGNGVSEDDNESIGEFNQNLISNNIVTIVLNMFKLNSSSDLKLFKCIKLLANLAFSPIEDQIPINERKLIIKTLTASLLSSSSNLKYNHKTFVTVSVKLTDSQIESRLYSIRAISNLLISKDLNELFDSENDIISTIPFLLEFPVQYFISNSQVKGWVTPFSSFQNGQLIDMIDLFNSIGSISNVLALDLQYPKELTFTLGFQPLIQLLELVNDDQIKSVILKLFANLVQLPICCARFFNWSSETDANFQNFDIIFKLFTLQEVSSIEIFLNVADFQPVLETLANYPPFIQRIQELMLNNAKETIHPLVYIVKCLLQVNPNLNFKKIKQLLN